MSKIGKSILKGAEEALAFAQGSKKWSKVSRVKVPEFVDVKAIRIQLDMTRSKFSKEFGLSTRTVEKWERGERVPEEAARAYLTVIAANPAAVRQALMRHHQILDKKAKKKRTLRSAK